MYKCKFHKIPLRKSKENNVTLVCDKCKLTKEFGHDGLYHIPSLSVKENLKFKKNKDYIMDCFDFAKMSTVMHSLQWEYRRDDGSYYIPRESYLRDCAGELLNQCVEGILNSESSDYTISCGGFCCRAYIDGNEILFDLKFVVEESFND